MKTVRRARKDSAAFVASIDLSSWAEFPETVAKLRDKYGTRIPALPDQEPSSEKNMILFRGQANSEWDLRTTLERTTQTPHTIQEYLSKAGDHIDEIQSLTGRRWDLSPYPHAVQEMKTIQSVRRVHVPHFEYLVYLRHHGFPSPLLDWTLSPYIAAYFAFDQDIGAERCAVFAFIETPEGMKGGVGGETLITTPGYNVTTTPRHFVQKAFYTVATRWDRDAQTHTFCPHQPDSAWSGVVLQDVIIKITIPHRDRGMALKELDDYNINAYTLFQNEDALVRTIGMRTFDLREA